MFGPASWWGQDLFGSNNALVGGWPIVVVKNGKVDIVEISNQASWYEAHRDLVEKRFREENLMPDQRR
jgi:branched-chain amino acid transport system substrate-binding protein